MPFDPGVLRTPLHVHAVKTPAEYARWHEGQLAALRHRGLSVTAWAADRGAPVRVSGGTWVVVCPCGNAPCASPEWDEARCADCGAIYRGLRWPSSIEAVADVLLVRPRAQRHWTPGDDIAALKAENVRYGRPETTTASARAPERGVQP